MLSKSLHVLLILCSICAIHCHQRTQFPLKVTEEDRIDVHSSDPLSCLDCKAMDNIKRPPPSERKFVSKIIDDVIGNISGRMKDKDLAAIFTNCFPNTLDTTVYRFAYDSKSDTYDTFVITGDINAMWLRDSTNQVLPYVQFVDKDAHLRDMIKGVITRQVNSVLIDPYANAFNEGNDGSQWSTDTTFKLGFLNTQVPAMTPRLHERKYELDSLCAVIKLSYAYYQATSDVSLFQKDNWKRAMSSIIQVIRDQQRGSDEGPQPYYFTRESTRPTETLMDGIGFPSKRIGMSRSPFRPSDDAAMFQFPIAANAMTVVSLQQLAEIYQKIGDQAKANDVLTLLGEIKASIEKFGVVTHPTFGKIYAYEVDGYGSSYFMDDANIPSLLSLPYLGYCAKDDPLYLNTRKFLLSSSNPYYAKGTAGDGIGGPHVGPGYIWPMSIMIRALTSTDEQEIAQCLSTLKNSTAGTGFMHESFWKDNVNQFTRPWFAWANSLFGELILTIAQDYPDLIF